MFSISVKFVVSALVVCPYLVGSTPNIEKSKDNEVVQENAAQDVRASPGFYNDPILNFLYTPGLSVKEIRDMEAETWHWYPWRRIEYEVLPDGLYLEQECKQQDSFDEMPDDLFTQTQRRNGAVVLHFLGAIYFFTVLAVVCDHYFLPAVECICEDLRISKDVAAATFMSVASTTPELFTNMISTFVANSTDMGLGTIIGSMLFNTLGVAACASLAASKPVKLDWLPLTRDSIIFTINLLILVGMAWDGQIQWYESSILFVLFIFYFCVLFQNHRWEKYFRNFIESRFSFCRPTDCDKEEYSEKEKESQMKPESKVDVTEEDEVIMPSKIKALFTVPETTATKKFWWFYTWPIKFVLLSLIPSPHYNRKWYPLTFVLCIVFIGANSYMVYWMVATIGHTFDIPESIMGLTFLACGGCLPEAIACVILIRRGEGSFGVSNSLGANSLAILMSLGVPWFVKTMVAGAGSTNAHIKIESYGIVFTITSLLLAVLALYVVLTMAGYHLKKVVGISLLTVYTVLITVAVLVELDLVFPSGNSCH